MNNPRNKPIEAARTQAERVFQKFGGVRKLRDCLENYAAMTGKTKAIRSISAIYRWNLPKSVNGNDGVIPSSALPHVASAARLEGIVLTSEDLDPRRV